MDSFLSHLKAEGIMDSHGAFTIDARLARSKMAAFQLSDPAGYVLKVVQAAVASGASTLEVKTGRDSLSISFDAEDGELTEPVIVGGAVLRVSSLHRCALRHLAVGLNAACGLVDELRWETPSGTLVLTQEGMSVQAQGSSNGLRFTARRKRSGFQWFKGTPFLEELRRLSESCSYSPLNLRIDGREIERPREAHACAPPVDHCGFAEPTVLLEGTSPGRGLRVYYGPSDGYEAVAARRWIRRPGKKGPLMLHAWSGQGYEEAGAVFSISPAFRGEGTWQAVLDGVSLKPVSATLEHPAASMIFDAGELTTDLSEFCLVQDQALAEKLSELGAILRAGVEAVSPQELEKALRDGGLDDDRLPEKVASLHETLRTHQPRAARTVEELALQTLSKRNLYFAPNIPADKLANARAVHQTHLPADERVIALCDDTLFGSGKEGFLVTDRRLCWKKVILPPNFLLWNELPYLDPQLSAGRITFRGPEDISSTTEVVTTALFTFLGEVHAVAPTPVEIDPEDERVIRTALQTIGKSSNLRCYPCIPAAWLEQIKSTYGSLWVDELPLVAYDDTLMGKADDGWICTRSMLYWRSTFLEPCCLVWKDVDPESVVLSSQGFKVGSSEISAHLSGLRPGMVQFARAMAGPQGALS